MVAPIQSIEAQPLSLADIMGRAQQYKAQQAMLQERDARSQQEQGKERSRQSFADLYKGGAMPTREQVYAVDPEYGMEFDKNQQATQQNNIQMSVQQMTAARQMATEIMSKMEQTGIPQNDPSWNQTFQQVADHYRPMMKAISPQTYHDGPIDPQHVIAVAGMTPGQQAQQKTQMDVQHEQALLPIKQQDEQFKYNLGAPDRQAAIDERKQSNQAKIDEMARRSDIAEQNLSFNKTKFEKASDPMTKPLPAESAGKLAMLKQAYQDVEEAKKMVFDKNGELNDTTLLAARVPFTAGVGENAREFRSRIENAVAAKLRLETGAAANQGEVENIAKRFMPSVMDSTKSAADKFDRLGEFLKSAGDYIRPGEVGGGAGKAQGTPSKYKVGDTASGPNGARMVYTDKGWSPQ